jgi:hypothetical protein
MVLLSVTLQKKLPNPFARVSRARQLEGIALEYLDNPWAVISEVFFDLVLLACLCDSHSEEHVVDAALGCAGLCWRL